MGRVGEPQACRMKTHYRHLVFGAINGSVMGEPQVMLCCGWCDNMLVCHYMCYGACRMRLCTCVGDLRVLVVKSCIPSFGDFISDHPLPVKLSQLEDWVLYPESVSSIGPGL